MKWRLTDPADPQRYVAWDSGQEQMLTGEPMVLEELEQLVDSETEVALTVTGPFRDVLSLDDEMGVFLLARTIIPNATLDGLPPVEETPESEIPEGAVS